METVLRHVVEGGPSWVYLAAHIVFSILDTLELFAKHRKEKRKGSIDADPVGPIITIYKTFRN